MEKNLIWKGLGWFLGAMVLFTLLSRAAYQQSTAVVSTKMPSAGTVDHTVHITGKTVQNQEVAVITQSGLRVGQVCVQEGQPVQQGQVLFTLDLPYLEQAIEEQSQELKKQQLSLQASRQQISAARKQQENQLHQAQESYDHAVSQAETTLERARQDVDQAQNTLNSYYESTQAEEAALIRIRDEARAALEVALNAENQPPETEATTEEVVEEITEEAVEVFVEEVVEEVLEELPVSTDPSAEADAVARAQQALAEAEAALDTFYRQQEQEDALLSALEQAQEKQADAASALDAAITTHSRAIASAGISTVSDSPAQIGQITCDQLQAQLDKLKALLAADGNIPSPADGIVTGCFVQTGQKTTDTTAIMLADLSQGCKFVGLATEEDSKYIGTGDKVQLQTSTGKTYADLPVTTFSAGETAGTYRLTVQLPPEASSLGTTMSLSFTRRSQPYSLCIPLSALRLDRRNRPYVLVAEEVSSVMGTELRAQKVSVTVLEQNETTAALAEGSIGLQDPVIVSSDRAIDIGSRIRVE